MANFDVVVTPPQWNIDDVVVDEAAAIVAAMERAFIRQRIRTHELRRHFACCVLFVGQWVLCASSSLYLLCLYVNNNPVESLLFVLCCRCRSHVASIKR